MTASSTGTTTSLARRLLPRFLTWEISTGGGSAASLGETMTKPRRDLLWYALSVVVPFIVLALL